MVTGSGQPAAVQYNVCVCTNGSPGLTRGVPVLFAGDAKSHAPLLDRESLSYPKVGGTPGLRCVRTRSAELLTRVKDRLKDMI